MKKTFTSLFPSEKSIVGEWISTSSCVVAELSAAAGFDFFVFDNEHAGWGGDNNISLVRAADAAGIPSIVRVTELGETPIKQALDLGATAVMIPGISSVEDAQLAVQYAKHSPNGRRGTCPYTRANLYGVKDLDMYYRIADKELSAVILILEGVEGINSIDEILEVPGVHSILVGPVDLSASMGIVGNTSDPRIEEAIKSIIEKCKNSNVYYLAQATSIDEAQKWIAHGADAAIMSDLMLLTDASKAARKAI